MTSSPRPLGPTDDTTRWTRSQRALFRRVPDGVLVLLLPDGEPELVTGPGGLLWDLLAVPTTLAELTTQLAARYDHDPEVVGRDLRQTLAELSARDLVVAAP
jgi:hypothetical protein